MPFMPEMFSFCGKRFQVYKRAHKTCDTVFPTRGRWVHRAVHLDTRCDGQAHGGCQAGCLIFWKEAWLKRDKPSSTYREPEPAKARSIAPVGSLRSAIDESDVLARAQGSVDMQGGATTYVCQATRLPYATSRLDWWDIRQYVEDYTSGNVSFKHMLTGFIYSIYYNLSQAGIGLGRPMRWLYDRLCPLWRGSPFPRKSGVIPEGEHYTNGVPRSATWRVRTREAATGDSSDAQHRKQESRHVLGCRNGALLREDLQGPQACDSDRRREDGHHAGDEESLHHPGISCMPGSIQRMSDVLPKEHLSVLERDLAREGWIYGPGRRSVGRSGLASALESRLVH